MATTWPYIVREEEGTEAIGVIRMFVDEPIRYDYIEPMHIRQYFLHRIDRPWTEPHPHQDMDNHEYYVEPITEIEYESYLELGILPEMRCNCPTCNEEQPWQQEKQR